MKTHLRSLVLVLIFLFFVTSLVIGQEQAASPMHSLLSEWIGTWNGEVQSQTPNGKVSTFQMELDIGQHSERNRLKWKLTYLGDQGRSERDYELIAEDLEAGRFTIDERNGIRIATSLIGTTLLSHFSIGGQTIWTRYELIKKEPSAILFELISAPSQSAITSQIGGQEVISLQPGVRQIAKLSRVDKNSKTTSTTGNKWTTWEKLETEPYRGKQDDIYFVNERVGWYANGAGKIYKTLDGGATWTKQLEQPGTYFRCLAFVDENQGFAGNIGPGYFPNVSDTCPLYETRDGGASWQKVTTIQGQPVVGLCAMQVLREEFVNAGQLEVRTRLIGVGRVGGPVAMIVSDDLGKSWQQIDISNQAAMAFDVHFFNRREGFLAAASDADVAQSNALILRTDDGGATWVKVYQSSRPYELTWKISFPSERVGYVTLQSYNPDPKIAERYLAKTIDGGVSWQEIPLVTNARVREFGIAFLNESVGWVGAMPHGFFTEDGGKTWVKADMGNAVNKIRLVPNGAKKLGFAIGSEVRKLAIE